MGKASSAKKVARAQRAGQAGGTAGKERRELGFPAAVAGVLAIGIVLVVFARTTRDVSAQEPTLSDHWHSAYGVYNCTIEDFEDPFMGQLDPLGIHSHQDGLIHIHPFSSSVTGDGAKMEAFFDSMEAELEDDILTMPDGRVLEAGVDCGGEPAILSVARFDGRDPEAGPIEIITENLSNITFENDGEAFTIALAPAGFDYPVPPSIGEQPADLSLGDPVLPEDLATLVPTDDTTATDDTVATDDTADDTTETTPPTDAPATTEG